MADGWIYLTSPLTIDDGENELYRNICRLIQSGSTQVSDSIDTLTAFSTHMEFDSDLMYDYKENVGL